MAKKSGTNATVKIGYDGSEADKGLEQTARKMKDLEKAGADAAKAPDKIADAFESAEKRIRQSSEKTTAEIEKRARAIHGAVGDASVRRSAGKILEQEEKTYTKMEEGEQRRRTLTLDHNFKLQRSANRQHLSGLRQQEKEYNDWYTKVLKARDNADKTRAKARSVAVRSEANLISKVIKRAGGGNLDFENAVKEAVSGFGPALQRQGLMAQGMSLHEAVNEQLRERVGGLSSRSLVYGGKRTPSLGGSQVSSGGGRGVGGIFGRLLGAGGGGIAGSLVGGLASGIGIGVGGYALANLGRAAIESAKAATAYERQELAARNLAGGQANLNALLSEYNKASGGAVSKTQQLEAVTRLLATGFARSAADVARFTRGSRGASIALGRPQDEVTQDIQLAISNTSVKRLDQIGLGISEVNDKIKELRKNNAGWTRETAFGDAVLTLLDEKYGNLSKTIEGQATGLERLAKAWDDLTLAQGKNAKSGINKGANALTNALNFFFPSDEAVKKFQDNSFLDIQPRMQNANNPFRRFAAGAFSNNPNSVIGRNNAQFLLDQGGNSLAGTRYRGGRGNFDYVNPLEEQQMEVKRNAYDQRLKMEAAHQQAITDEVEQYQTSREASIRNYEKSVAREEEDFYRQRARGLRDYEKTVLNIMRDAQEREAEANDDLAKNIEEMNSDFGKRMARSERDYNEEREKAEKDHRLNMLKAAGQLDAIALLNERLSYNKENKERKKQHDQQVQDDKDALAERIQDAIDANNERLEDARKADAKRLADMASDRKQQLADEDEDRGIQLNRAKEDHDDELEEMDRLHGLRMDKLNKQAEDENKAFEDALEADLADVGIYLDGYMEKTKAKDKLITDWYDRFTDRLEDLINQDKIKSQQNTYNPKSAAGPRIPQYASGGYVGRTGLAYLHAGEYVMPSSAVSNAVTSNSKRVEVHPGAFQVYTTPGMEMQVGKMIEETLVRILEAA